MSASSTPQDNHADELLSDLAERFVEEHRRGEHPNVESYAARHPEIASRIRQLFPTLMVIEELGPPIDTASALQAQVPLTPIPSQIGDYRLVREIGRGGMGIVFEAEQVSLSRAVALKVLGVRDTLDSRMIERFQVEARSAARLHHPRIIPVYDVGQADGYHYYAMQRIDGIGLDQVLTLLGDRSPTRTSSRWALVSTITEDDRHQYYREVAQIGMHVAESLAYAHGQGILHRDIKPSNLILDAHGAIWVADFGLAKAFDSDQSATRGGLTVTGEIVGTMRYMAPERFRGWSDPRSDIYALGLTLYELLTLQPAFRESDRVQLIQEISQVEPKRPRSFDSQIPLDLETIVLKSIEKEINKRYLSAEELATDLKSFLEYRPIAARRPSRMERLGQWGRRNPALAAVAAFIVVIAFGASLLSWQLAIALRASERYKAQAEQAELERTQQLRQSLSEQARFARHSNQPAARSRALDALLKASAIRPGLELRNEAIAALALMDLRWPPEWQMPLQTAAAILSPNLDSVLVSDGKESILLKDRSGRVLQRFPGVSFDARFSADGEFLLLKTGPRFGEPGSEHLRLYRSRTGQQLAELTGWFPGSAFAFHPNNKEWVCYNGGHFLMYSVAEQRELGRIKHVGQNISLKYHPSGDYLAFFEAGTRTVFQLDFHTGEVTRLMDDAPAGLLGRIAFSPDGSMLAIGAMNWRCYVWDVLRRELKTILIGHSAEVTNVAFSPDARLVATSGWDRTIRLWNPVDGRSLGRMEGNLIQFSPNNDAIAILSGSTAAIVGCVPSREFQMLRGHEGKNPRWCDFSPDGRILVTSGDETVRFWNASDGAMAGSITLPGTLSASFTSDGKSLITASYAGLHRWPVRMSQLTSPKTGADQAATHDVHNDRWEIGPPTPLFTKYGVERRAAITPDLAEVVSASESEDQLEIYSLLTGTKRSSIPCQKWPNNCCVSPDGKWVVASSFRNRWATVFELASGRQVRELPGADTPGVAFSPDSQRLVIASPLLGGQVISTTTWQEIAQLPNDSNHNQLLHLQFDPTGSMIAVAHTNGVIRLLDSEDYHELARLESPDGQRPIILSFSPNASRLAVGVNGGVELWDMELVRTQLAKLNLDWEPSPENTGSARGAVELVIVGGDLER